ncbi:MAG: three-Cys-motif partner protein TcmP [Rhodospirillales bacterium]|nr:three-Cys-motif partner protein TcmP [Rhodospirillales bacterium]
MAAPKTTVWPLELHTRAKHEILKRYLQAWIRILTQGGFPQVLYIDGFAGPGRYSEGEKGSPIIALEAALGHATTKNSKFLFCFIEKEIDRAHTLQKIIDDMERPENIRVKVAAGETFEAAFSELLRFYTSRKKGLPPTFAFIDPFGWAGTPFYVVKEIMKNPSCEVFVTFMYEEINRFIGHPDQEKNFDVFFGTKEWREGVSIENSRNRNRFLHDLYMKQLSLSANVKFVRSFEMRNQRDVTDYYLFYGTNNLLGMKKMKEAMWKVDESGEFSFSDATDPNQLILFAKEPRFDKLQEQIVSHFQGLDTTVGEIEKFVICETAFREMHYKTQILRKMELSEPPQIEVIGQPKNRRRGSYGDPALRIKFLN